MQKQSIDYGNTKRKKTLYEKNAMYGTNLTQSQMQQMQRKIEQKKRLQQQKRRLQQQKQRQQQLQLNDISIDDLYPQTSKQSSFQMSNPMRQRQQQKKPQIQQVYPQSKSSSFQMSNPMRQRQQQKKPQIQQVYPQKQSSFQMTNPMGQRQRMQQQRAQVQGQQKRNQQQQLKKAIQQEKQLAATRKQKEQMQQYKTQKSLYQQKQQQQKRRQQIRTLINNLRALNPKYYWEGFGVGKGGYAPTLPIANEILFELSNRAQLNEDHIDQINDILQQKTEDDAIFKLGRSPAFGSKYRTYNDYLKSAQRRQMLQQMYV